MSIAAMSVAQAAIADATTQASTSKVPPKRQTVAVASATLVPEAR